MQTAARSIEANNQEQDSRETRHLIHKRHGQPLQTIGAREAGNKLFRKLRKLHNGWVGKHYFRLLLCSKSGIQQPDSVAVSRFS